MSSEHVGMYEKVGNLDVFKLNDGDELMVACCDCGLVHEWHLEVLSDGVIKLQVRRDDWSTGQLRKSGNYKYQPTGED